MESDERVFVLALILFGFPRGNVNGCSKTDGNFTVPAMG